MNRKLITCEMCGKQEWRHPLTRFCLECSYKRGTQQYREFVAKQKAEKLNAQKETKK